MGIVFANAVGFELPVSVGALVTLGSLLIVFLAGFETNLDFLTKHLKPALLLGVAGFLAPFAGLTFVLGYVLHAPLLVTVIGAAALADTSISIVYTTLQQYELADLPFGRLVLAGTLMINLMEDVTVTSATFLWSTAVVLTVVLLGVLLVAALVLPRLMNWVDARFGGSFSNVTTRALLFSLAILAGISTIIQVPGILFVFLMGLLFSRFNRVALLADFRKFAFALFVPLYFVAVGLRVDLGFVGLNLAVLGTLVATASVVKMGSLFPVARRAFGPDRAPSVVTLMNARLTSATVILVLALSLGLIAELWYSLLITSVVILALGSAIVLRALPAYRSAEAAREKLGSLDEFPGLSRPPGRAVPAPTYAAPPP